MPLKYKPYYYFVLCAILFVSFLSCGNDDTTVDQINNDPGPTGFLGEIDWVKTFGGSNDDVAVSIVQSNDGEYAIVGSTKSTDGDITDKNTSDSDYWLIKLTPGGEIVWTKTYGGSADDVATNIKITSDGGYIISGHSRSNDGDVSGNEGSHDYWVVKINSTGDIQWENNFGFSGVDQAFNVIEIKDGGYFVTGVLDVVASGGQGNEGRSGLHDGGVFWGIKLDSNGNSIWKRYFGGTKDDSSQDVIETSDSGFLLVGFSESIDGDITDNKGSYDFWVVKINSNGQKIWAKSFGGSETDKSYAVTKTSNGDYIIVGDTRSTDQDVTSPLGNADVWIVRFNESNGNIIWEKTYGGTEFESAKSITNLSNGKFLITGNSRSTNGNISNNIGLNDAWIFIIDENGNLEYERTVGGTNLDFANHAIETTNNKLIIVGNTDSDDVDILKNKGGKDVLIIKIK